MKNGLLINHNGTIEYYMKDELHRVDGPAIELANGTTRWFLHGKKHRVDGPAEEWADGDKFWYLNGEKHRVDGPAEELADGTKRWFLHGKSHSVDGPAIVYSKGGKRWYLHGKELVYPDEVETMAEWFQKLKTDEEYSLPFINKINGLIEFINNPTDKQKRLNAMKWKL